MKPKPFSALNHFTVPCAMLALLPGVQMQVPHSAATWALNPRRPTAHPTRESATPAERNQLRGRESQMHEHKTLTTRYNHERARVVPRRPKTRRGPEISGPLWVG